jgi:DoxX-like family
MQSPKTVNRVLWSLQALLALFFAGASGAPKLLLPPDMLPMPIPLPAAFITFIGTCEVLGTLGLVLPGVLRIRPRVTVAAATCLALLTVCAATYQLMGKQPATRRSRWPSASSRAWSPSVARE